jgi:2-amino-4-hydroxy-6-hydroxymethyldihydropteridine diphosphokinase
MTILIGLGSNLSSSGCASPADTVRAALAALEDENLGRLRVSPLYTSAPVPRSDQPWFVNAVAEIEGCAMVAADQLLGRLHRVEDRFERKREKRWASRTLDLDLLAFGDTIVGWQGSRPDTDDGRLIVPHAHLHERLFVLRPLMDIAPGWQHPVLARSVDEMLADLAPGQVVDPVVDTRS